MRTSSNGAYYLLTTVILASCGGAELPLDAEELTSTVNELVEATSISSLPVQITYPPPVQPAFTPLHRSGSPLEIRGRAVALGFLRFDIDWAPGRDATTGWSRVGVLVQSRTSCPLATRKLGSWTPPRSLIGEHTIRLSVERRTTGGYYTDTVITNVYLQPDLVSPAWPQLVPNTPAGLHTVARRADGKKFFILCDQARDTGATCQAVAADGSSRRTVSLTEGPYDNLALAGQLDGKVGDEVVVADAGQLRIYSADLQHLRSISSRIGGEFRQHALQLADLDGDGRLEIVAASRRVGESGVDAALEVFRGDGRPFASALLPLVPWPEGAINSYSRLEVLVADLGGPAGKEILLFASNFEGGYTLHGFNRDGSVFSELPSKFIASEGNAGYLKAADLDGDGRIEIAVFEGRWGYPQTRLLDDRGNTVPGWPVIGLEVQAFADFDKDGQKEILTRLPGSEGLGLVRRDASRVGPAFPVYWGSFGPPVIADADGDGYLDVVVIDHNLAAYDPHHTVKVISRDGSIIKSWKLFGMSGYLAGGGIPFVGDFTGRGRMEIAASLILLFESAPSSWTSVHSELVLLDAGVAFNSASAPWALPQMDPQNSRLAK